MRDALSILDQAIAFLLMARVDDQPVSGNWWELVPSGVLERNDGARSRRDLERNGVAAGGQAPRRRTKPLTLCPADGALPAQYRWSLRLPGWRIFPAADFQLG